MPDDRIQREIEDILSKLDDLPAERARRRGARRRSSDLATAFQRAVIAPLGRISLGQLMLTALALIILSLFLMRVNPAFAQWVIIAGLILFLTSFGLSFFTRGARASGRLGGALEKRWRGRPMELDEPGLADRLRAWLRSRRRPRS